MTLQLLLSALLLGLPIAIFILTRNGKGYQRISAKQATVLKIVAVVMLIAFVIFPFSFHTVEPGQVAVVKVWGKASDIKTPGTYFNFWLSDEYIYYNTTVQQEDIRTACYSLDAQTMDIELVVQYKIHDEQAIEIANLYGTLEMLSNKIESISIEKAKGVLSQKSAMAIIEARSTISPSIEQAIVSAVTDDYYVDIVTVVVTNIDFSDAFESTVEEKMIAEQQKLKAEYEKEKAIIEAEKELEVSKLQAQAVIEKAQGDAEALLRQAEAQAKSTKLRSVEIARMMGFNITEERIDDEITYQIDFEGKSEEEIKLISDYLKYVSYLETWDGVLPTTLVTDGGASVIVTP